MLLLMEETRSASTRKSFVRKFRKEEVHNEIRALAEVKDGSKV